jgi:hypothetical protein
MKKPNNWNDLMCCEKINIYKSFLNKEHSEYTDKLFAKKLVNDVCGDKIKVAKVIKVLKSYDDLDQNDLDPKYIIKSTHGSGWNINIKENTDINTCKRLLKSWNKCYSQTEKQYTYLQPAFFIEEKINDKILGNTGEAIVYMIRCVRGNPISIGIKHGSYMNNYDINWNPIDSYAQKIPIDLLLNENASKFSDMLHYASILSKPFEFVRMDFYLSEKDIYFSEFTFTPNAGKQVFTKEVEYMLGKLWD